MVCLLATAALVAAPHAAADPNDLLPYCSDDQTPMDNNCRLMPEQGFPHEGTGVNPDLPYGLDPANPAVI